MKNPCNKCPDRKQACHATCERGLEYEAFTAKQREERNKQRSIIMGVYESALRRSEKIRRRRK